MANNGAEKGIGGLFVDLGLKGLGGMLKGLNSVSAGFLLTKNAATQALKPILDMSKQAGQSVVALDKWNSVTGISVSRLSELRDWAKLNNVSFESFVGQLSKLQQAMIGLQYGRDQSLIDALQGVGLNPRQFNYSDPEKFLKSILDTTKDIDQATRMYVLTLFGLSSEMAYIMDHANKGVDEIYQRSEEQRENLRLQNERWNELNVSVNALGEKLVASAPIQQGLKAIIEFSKDWHKIINDDNGEWTNFKNNIQDTIRPLKEIWKWLNKIYELSGVKKVVEENFGEATKEHPILSSMGPAGLSIAKSLTDLDKNTLTNPNFYDYNASPFSMGNLAKRVMHPFQTSDVINAETKNRNLTVNQYIQTSDPVEAGKQSVDGIQQQFNVTRDVNRSGR